MIRRPEKILIIQLKRLGDVLLTTPVLPVLKRRFPLARIDFLVDTNFSDVLYGNPHLDRIVVFPKHFLPRLQTMLAIRKERYDWVIDFMANGRSAWAAFISGAPVRASFEGSYPRFIYNFQGPKRMTPAYASTVKLDLADFVCGKPDKAVSFDDEPKKILPQIFINHDKIEAWRLVMESLGIRRQNRGPLIFLAPTSRQPSRRWDIGHYGKLARLLAEKVQANVICLWGPGERQAAQKVVDSADHCQVRIAPQMKSIMDLAAYLSLGDCLVTNCNGTKHAAVAVGLPALTIHTSSDPVVWNPPANPLYPYIRMETLDCIGCRKNICVKNSECSGNLQPEQVFDAVEKLLSFVKNEKNLAKVA
ncbi:MAG: glycosyltransferase family 9 protein [Elusimicrobia bacterium]|nr:glycosyltransferase family 9 protein [Elusimicrobiota bacterium]